LTKSAVYGLDPRRTSFEPFVETADSNLPRRNTAPYSSKPLGCASWQFAATQLITIAANGDLAADPCQGTPKL
jgi:hypothetical protein